MQTQKLPEEDCMQAIRNIAALSLKSFKTLFIICMLISAYISNAQPCNCAITGVVTNINCGSSCNGAIDITATCSGGNNLIYSWNDFATTEDRVGLCTGTYYVTVTDMNGCTETASFTIASVPADPINAGADMTICAGNCVNLNVTSTGSSIYAYNWTPPGNSNTGSTITVCPTVTTTYIVTGTDAATGCSTTDAVTVNVIPTPSPQLDKTDTVICDNNTSFNIHVFDNGAFAGGYPAGTTFEWIGYTGQTTDDFLFVNGPGVYTVIVTLPPSYGGCQAYSNTITIGMVPCDTLQIVFHDDCDSSLCATATGGTAPYTYYWSTSPMTMGPCLSNAIPCQLYTVTVVDAYGNAVSATHQKASITAVVTNATPGQHNGAIDLTVSCIPSQCYPLGFLWCNGSTTEDQVGLDEGTFCCVTIYDACGNEYHCCYNVGVNDPCIVFKDDYNYDGLWTTEYIDASGNPEPSPLVTVSGSKVNFNQAPCDADYRVYRSLPGGALQNQFRAEFEFKPISGNVGGTGIGVSLFCLTAGSLEPYRVAPYGPPQAYTNQDFLEVNLMSPANPSNYTTQTKIYAAYKDDANAPVFSAPLSFTWGNVYYVRLDRLANGKTVSLSVFSDPARTIHIPGSPICFTIPTTVTGLNTLQHATINQGSPARDFTGWVDSTSIDTCFHCNTCAPIDITYAAGCDSTFCITPTGDNGPYTYIWSTGESTACIKYLPCVAYTVTVTDACGNSKTKTIKVPGFTFTRNNPTCINNGSLCINVNNCGGTATFSPTYTYQWSIIPVQNTPCATGLGSGVYCVTVTDSIGNTFNCCDTLVCSCKAWSGCIRFNNTVIPSYTALISFIPKAGCTYTYHWFDNSTNPHHYQFDFVSNSITYTPPLGQVGSPQIEFPLHLTVTSCCGDSVTLTYSPIVITITGNNPCCTPTDGSLTATVTGGSECLPGGGASYSYQWQKWNPVTNKWDNIALPNNLSGGKYHLIITDCCGNKKTSVPYTLNAFQPLAVTASKTDATHCGPNYDGTITLALTGFCGDVSYKYKYYPFLGCTCLPNNDSIPKTMVLNSTTVISGLTPGIYIIYVTKECNGISTTIQLPQVQINFPLPKMKLHFTGCNSQVCIEAEACCNLTYNWKKLVGFGWVNFGAQTQCRSIGAGVNQLHPGATYKVSVKDCKGNTTFQIVTIPNYTYSVVNTTCGLNNGSICVNGLGGVTYNWTPLKPNSNCISGLASGNYHLSAVFANGNIWDCDYTINASVPVTFTATKGSCMQTCINVLTGTPYPTGDPYNITWSPCGVPISVHYGSCYDVCGCYDVWVTDGKGCTASKQVVIEGVKINDDDSCGLCADVCLSNSCPNYSFIWSNGATTSCIKCLSAGNYTVTVTDCNGQTFTCSKTVVHKPFQCQVISLNAAQIRVKVTGGCTPYKCEWTLNGIPKPNMYGTTNPNVFIFPNFIPNDTYTMLFTDACGDSCIRFIFNAKEAQAEIKKMEEPMLAPNPNNGTFKVFFKEGWFDKDVNYQVLDVTGKVLIQDHTIIKESEPVQFDLSEKAKGVYFIRFTSGDASWNTKFIVQ